MWGPSDGESTDDDGMEYVDVIAEAAFDELSGGGDGCDHVMGFDAVVVVDDADEGGLVTRVQHALRAFLHGDACRLANYFLTILQVLVVAPQEEGVEAVTPDESPASGGAQVECDKCHMSVDLATAHAWVKADGSTVATYCSVDHASARTARSTSGYLLSGLCSWCKRFCVELTDPKCAAHHQVCVHCVARLYEEIPHLLLDSHALYKVLGPRNDAAALAVVDRCVDEAFAEMGVSDTDTDSGDEGGGWGSDDVFDVVDGELMWMGPPPPWRPGDPPRLPTDELSRAFVDFLRNHTIRRLQLDPFFRDIVHMLGWEEGAGQLATGAHEGARCAVCHIRVAPNRGYVWMERRLRQIICAEDSRTLLEARFESGHALAGVCTGCSRNYRHLDHPTRAAGMQVCPNCLHDAEVTIPRFVEACATLYALVVLDTPV